MEQQLPLAQGVVLFDRGLLVGSDVDTVQPHLVVLHLRVALLQADASGPDGLDLRAGEGDARLVGLLDEVLVTGTAVGGDGALAVFGGFCHDCFVLRAPRFSRGSDVLLSGDYWAVPWATCPDLISSMALSSCASTPFLTSSSVTSTFTFGSMPTPSMSVKFGVS